jgi:SAM-dependent methyltransferase
VPVAQEVVAAWPAKVGDSCGQFFGTCLHAFSPELPANANVLEIGCCEYDWLDQATKTWPEMSFTGIDWRTYKRASRAVVIKGDVMTQPFPAESFDWIVSISAIEHVGLGHYSRDPVDPDGDSIAIRRAFDWLKPGGWLSFDVPYNPTAYQVVGTSHRIYDDAAVESRLVQGLPWRLAWSGVAGTGDTHQLIAPRPKKGGEDFDYIGFWWQKPEGVRHG